MLGMTILGIVIPKYALRCGFDLSLVSGECHAALGSTSLAIFEAMVFCATFRS
jgi:hypothetical protein